VVVTADALPDHHQAAWVPSHRQRAHYPPVAKANQPVLGGRCAATAWHNVPVGGHGAVGALRRHGRDPRRPLASLGISPG
jgi:hypothetical protein